MSTSPWHTIEILQLQLVRLVRSKSLSVIPWGLTWPKKWITSRHIAGSMVENSWSSHLVSPSPVFGPGRGWDPPASLLYHFWAWPVATVSSLSLKYHLQPHCEKENNISRRVQRLPVLALDGWKSMILPRLRVTYIPVLVVSIPFSGFPYQKYMMIRIRNTRWELRLSKFLA